MPALDSWRFQSGDEFVRKGDTTMPNDLSIAAALGALLKERKQTVAVAESSAGGLISATLLGAPGASAYFVGGGVTYTQAARRGPPRARGRAAKSLRPPT